MGSNNKTVRMGLFQTVNYTFLLACTKIIPVISYPTHKPHAEQKKKMFESEFTQESRKINVIRHQLSTDRDWASGKLFIGEVDSSIVDKSRIHQTDVHHNLLLNFIWESIIGEFAAVQAKLDQPKPAFGVNSHNFFGRKTKKFAFRLK